MSVLHGNPNYRRKYDAFVEMDKTGVKPLTNAVLCAQRLRQANDYIEKALDGDIEAKDRVNLTLALSRGIPDEIAAWIKIAEFVYAKPKQILEVEGKLTLEQLLTESRG